VDGASKFTMEVLALSFKGVAELSKKVVREVRVSAIDLAFSKTSKATL
jgi:hypothetical protein